MWDERSFDTRSYDVRSWLTTVADTAKRWGVRLVSKVTSAVQLISKV